MNHATFFIITLCTVRQAAMLCVTRHAIGELCAECGLYLAWLASASDLIVLHGNSCSFDSTIELQHYNAVISHTSKQNV